MKRKVICPNCSKITITVSETISGAKCTHCNGYLHKPRKTFIYVPCIDPSCHFENKMPVFGWNVAQCQSCSKQITHPAAKPVGAHLKGQGLKKDARITIKFSSAEKKLIETMAKKHDSTSSAIIRQMIRYFDDKLC